MRKLMYRVLFPFELKLPNTTDGADGQDAMYSLFAVVVHVGSGPHHGGWGAGAGGTFGGVTRQQRAAFVRMLAHSILGWRAQQVVCT
jgi:hypothetical protein